MRSPRSITSAEDFRAAYRRGRRARVDGVTVYARSVPGDEARLGLVVRAGTGGAVARNRLRRRLRAIYRAHGPRPGYDVVVRTDPSAPLNYQELERTVTRAFVGAGLGRLEPG
ncbi:MAG: ribonuclease P protein component [Actinomycetota bacterium]